MMTLLRSIWGVFLILAFSPIGTDMSLIFVLLSLGLEAVCADFLGFFFFAYGCLCLKIFFFSSATAPNHPPRCGLGVFFV